MMKTPVDIVLQPDGPKSLNGDQRTLSKQLSPKALKRFRVLFYLGCATSIILVVLIGIVSYNSLNRQQMLEKWVERTYQVLRKTDAINSFFSQALVPGEDKNPPLRPDHAALSVQNRQNLDRQVDALIILVKDNSRQLQQAFLLQKQIDELWRTSSNTTTVSVNTDWSGRVYKSQKDKISATIQRIKQAGEILLSNRESAYNLSGKQTQGIVVAGSILILLIVSFLIYMILKELDNRIRAYEKEHELNQLKSRFVTLASHEFRTPLSSVLLSASLIEKYIERDKKEAVVKHVIKIKQVINNLEGILEDFLSLEKLEDGRVKVEFTYFDLVALCVETLTAIKIMAKPGQQLIYERSGEMEMVYLDRTLVEKTLNGLLSNAIKYAGEEACIRLITEVTANNIMIAVKDNGVGIAEEDQKKLFTIFYRIHNTGNISGTGLGLNIVKRYVQLMSGTLHFSSVPSEETCFNMTFPVNR